MPKPGITKLAHPKQVHNEQTKAFNQTVRELVPILDSPFFPQLDSMKMFLGIEDLIFLQHLHRAIVRWVVLFRVNHLQIEELLRNQCFKTLWRLLEFYCFHFLAKFKRSVNHHLQAH